MDAFIIVSIALFALLVTCFVVSSPAVRRNPRQSQKYTKWWLDSEDSEETVANRLQLKQLEEKLNPEQSKLMRMESELSNLRLMSRHFSEPTPRARAEEKAYMKALESAMVEQKAKIEKLQNQKASIKGRIGRR